MGILQSHNHHHSWFVHMSSLVNVHALGHRCKCRLRTCQPSSEPHTRPYVSTALPLELIVSRGWSWESTGLACIWVAEHLTALLRCSLPRFWAISISDVCHSASGGQLGLQSALWEGGREGGQCHLPGWLWEQGEEHPCRESSTRMAVKIILDFNCFSVVQLAICSV